MASLYLMAVFIEPRLAILAELYVAILAGPEQQLQTYCIFYTDIYFGYLWLTVENRENCLDIFVFVCLTKCFLLLVF